MGKKRVMCETGARQFCIGSVVGPHPYPEIIAELQSVVGREVRKQFLEAEGKLPDVLVACVSGGQRLAGVSLRVFAIWLSHE